MSEQSWFFFVSDTPEWSCLLAFPFISMTAFWADTETCDLKSKIFAQWCFSTSQKTCPHFLGVNNYSLWLLNVCDDVMYSSPQNLHFVIIWLPLSCFITCIHFFIVLNTNEDILMKFCNLSVLPMTPMLVYFNFWENYSFNALSHQQLIVITGERFFASADRCPFSPAKPWCLVPIRLHILFSKSMYYFSYGKV